MYTVRIPKVGTVSADTLATLGSVAWDAVHTANGGFGYGVSEVGSGWPVKHDGVLIGTLRYNGRFDGAAVRTVGAAVAS